MRGFTSLWEKERLVRLGRGDFYTLLKNGAQDFRLNYEIFQVTDFESAKFFKRKQEQKRSIPRDLLEIRDNSSYNRLSYAKSTVFH